MTEVRLTGGCQCGAVRYALTEQPSEPHVCHCRMCQKAFGSFFAPLTGVPLSAFKTTRGDPAIFKSSDRAERGFCRRCGTPLTFHYVTSPRIAVSIGSLDHPERVKPKAQYGVEGRLPWFASIAGLPGEKTTEQDDPELAAAIAGSNRQHPDHDTKDWPPS
ncbi:MAG: GFA family protein [Hyphomicrobiales bacterium]|nr:GFA family protein [Hyphomicrobiales bacterium]